jgi:hypothetical protein
MLLLASCGADVVVDADPARCAAPEPAGAIVSCHGAKAIGDAETVCSNLCLDEAQRVYESVCSGGACECFYEGVRACRCERSDPADSSCDPADVCCPAPWL